MEVAGLERLMPITIPISDKLDAFLNADTVPPPREARLLDE